MHYYQRIRNVREDLDIKQYEFAAKIGVDKKTYSLYETGYRDIPIEIVDRIILLLNLSFDYIFNFTDVKKYDNMKPIDMSNISINIRKLREGLNLTQGEFANNIGVSQQTISNLENNKNITINNLYLICSRYNISADLLVGKIDKVRDLELQK